MLEMKTAMREMQQSLRSVAKPDNRVRIAGSQPRSQTDLRPCFTNDKSAAAAVCSEIQVSLLTHIKCMHSQAIASKHAVPFSGRPFPQNMNYFARP